MTGRRLCLTALLRMERDGAYSNLVLNALLSQYSLSREERALFTRLFYGVLEKKRLLDFQLEQLSSRPLCKLDDEVRCILEMGLYQLCFLDAVPDRAAVDESVRLCDFAHKKSAAGFVNALLRSFIRAGKKLASAQNPAVALSVDDSIWQLLSRQYGTEQARAMLTVQSTPQLYLRHNPEKGSMQQLLSTLEEFGVMADSCAELPGCVRVSGNLPIGLPCFEQGLFYVQDLSSQYCCAALEAAGAQRILDLCAAPGGKSFTLALTAGAQTPVVSCDINAGRVRLISDGAARLGITNITPTVQDGTVFNPALGLFDRVLCDAPCSGLGVLAKKPEIRYKNIKEDALFPLQSTLLAQAARYCAPNGLLVYSTCTVNRCENEQVVEDFLQKHPEFSQHPLCFSPDCFYRTFLPGKDEGDGFFVAAFQKQGGEQR